MNKTRISKVVFVISIMIIASFLLSACDSPAPRIPETHYFDPGGPFTTNINNEDQRRQVRCSLVFEVVDEDAIEELRPKVAVIRNSVLTVLGELTLPELTTHRDLEDIAERILERVNEDLATHVPLIIGVYFTDISAT